MIRKLFAILLMNALPLIAIRQEKAAESDPLSQY